MRGDNMKLEDQVRYIHEAFTSHIEEDIIRDAEITYKIERVSDKIEELNNTIKGLVSVWEQARGILTFVKWLVGISGSVVAVIAFFKGMKG